MRAVAPALKKTLDQKLEDAVRNGLEATSGLRVRRVSVEDQRRFVERMSCAQLQLAGDGWTGVLVLLVPDEMGRDMAARASGAEPQRGVYRGSDLAEGYGTMLAAVGVEFARSFAPDPKIHFSMPVLVAGTDLAVSFPWGGHFESRQCFSSPEGPLWVILRLSHMN